MIQLYPIIKHVVEMVSEFIAKNAQNFKHHLQLFNLRTKKNLLLIGINRYLILSQ